jgi:hypothetical protein
MNELIEHTLNANDIALLELLLRNEIALQIKERPSSVTDPDSFNEMLLALLDKLGRSYEGLLYEHPRSDEIGLMVQELWPLIWPGERNPPSEDR